MTKYQEKHFDLVPLIDGDILTYRLGFAADAGAKKESPEEWKSLDYLEWALHLVDNQMQSILDMFGGKGTSWLYLSGKDNYRFDVAKMKPYKGNRDPNNKPKYYQELRDYMTQEWGAVMSQGIEADDCLGIQQFSCNDKSTVICTIDKDLNMIPGYHFNFVKGEFYDVKIKDADIFFLRQMLTGDSTDNIPGIRGVGPKTSFKLVPEGTDAETAIQTVAEAYRQCYKDQASEAAEEIARLLWIQRKENERPKFLDEIQAAIVGQV